MKNSPVKKLTEITLQSLVDGLGKVIKGKGDFLTYLVTCLVAGGHVLIEDVPGLGKTTVAKTLARLISTEDRPIKFRRIQFTPDLLPYDITGVDLFDPDMRAFSFSPGPVFANIVLADEINRSSPKVQSALLEVMAENQVTVGNRTHHLEDLFFVIATQNPLEMEGTYSLPLAQLDRFMMRLSIGYPDEMTELTIIKEDPSHRILPEVEPVCTMEEIILARQEAKQVYCDERLMTAVVDLSRKTRDHGGVSLGISPRGCLMLIDASRSYALLQGRSYVIDQDLIDLAPLVLSHRIVLNDYRLHRGEFIREIALESLKGIHT